MIINFNVKSMDGFHLHKIEAKDDFQVTPVSDLKIKFLNMTTSGVTQRFPDMFVIEKIKLIVSIDKLEVCEILHVSQRIRFIEILPS